MSADNGIYIASFPNGEIRVAYGSESVIGELETHLYTPEDRRLRIAEIFGGSPVFTDSEQAEEYAVGLDPDDTEYGVIDVSFSVNFLELGDEIAPPALRPNACPHCSTDTTQVSHAPTTSTSTNCSNPDLPYNIVVQKIRAEFPGIKEYQIARVVVEALAEAGKL